MRIDRERLVPTNAPLVGFEGTKIYPLSAIMLPVTVGRPNLNSWKAITSTYHLIIKFHTKYEVGEVCGDQMATRECYIAMQEMDNHLQAMNIEEQRTVAESVEGLEEILLDNSRPNRTTRIDTLASPLVR